MVGGLIKPAFAKGGKKHTANAGPVRIQYKCLVPIYVFIEMKLHGLIFYKTEL